MNIHCPYGIIITETKKVVIPGAKRYFLFFEKESDPREIPGHLLKIGFVLIPEPPRNSLTSIGFFLNIARNFSPRPPEVLFLDAFLTQFLAQRSLIKHAHENAQDMLKLFLGNEGISILSNFLKTFHQLVGQKMVEKIWENDDAFQSILNDIDRIIEENEKRESIRCDI